MKSVLALDQGTTGSAALVFDGSGAVRGTADREIAQSYPASGHVEHDPDEIFATTVAVGRDALAAAGVGAREVAAIGITNQRETTVVWERDTGRPIHPAVVWQSRASAKICESLRARGLEPLVRERTGLVIDAYFSATKVRWILDQVAGAQARAEHGELLCGTVDTWLVWKLTSGRTHVTDVSNASRTMVFDIHRQRWDDELLAALDLPRVLFATPVPSKGVVGETDPAHFGAPLPIAGIAGDQQAALFGQTCFGPGEAKNTYGTGCFLLANTGATAAPARGGLLTTVAWDIGEGVRYALEGSAFVTGAAVQWLRMGSASSSARGDRGPRDEHAGNEGVYFGRVHRLAPHWDMYARGLLIGIERGTTRAHIARATLESIAYQRASVEAMAEAGQPIDVLRPTAAARPTGSHAVPSDVLGVPWRSRRSGRPLRRCRVPRGLAVGVWKTRSLRDGAPSERVTTAIRRTNATGFTGLAKSGGRSLGWSGLKARRPEPELLSSAADAGRLQSPEQRMPTHVRIPRDLELHVECRAPAGIDPRSAGARQDPARPLGVRRAGVDVLREHRALVEHHGDRADVPERRAISDDLSRASSQGLIDDHLERAAVDPWSGRRARAVELEPSAPSRGGPPLSSHAGIRAAWPSVRSTPLMSTRISVCCAVRTTRATGRTAASHQFDQYTVTQATRSGSGVFAGSRAYANRSGPVPASYCTGGVTVEISPLAVSSRTMGMPRSQQLDDDRLPRRTAPYKGPSRSPSPRPRR